MKRLSNGALPLALVLMTGCTNGQDPVETPTVPVDQGVAGQAIEDLSVRLGVPAGEVKLVREDDVTWRDGSLGCPKKDMMYTQALVEGKRIVLQVDGTQYHYHAGSDRPPFYCKNPVSPASGYSAE